MGGLLQGRISKHWSTIQEYHERHRRQETASHGRNAQWDVQAIRLVCEFNKDLWNFRNDEIHGRTQQEQTQKRRENIELEVHKLYARKPQLLPRFPSVSLCH
mmetsp:Transcript_24392/g.34975  ORF Transcript_24392/g.34975 Transcript_24392/m.34975 type:complete len:102 (+) Transcript_24392:5697-6002(+)